MIAKLKFYHPETGECTIDLGGRIYEFNGVPEILRDFYEFKGRHTHPDRGWDLHENMRADLEALVEKYRPVAYS